MNTDKMSPSQFWNWLTGRDEVATREVASGNGTRIDKRPDVSGLTRENAAIELVNGGWVSGKTDAFAVVDREAYFKTFCDLSDLSAAHKLATEGIHESIAEALLSVYQHRVNYTQLVPRVLVDLAPCERSLKASAAKLKAELEEIGHKLEAQRSTAVNVISTSEGFPSAIEKARNALHDAQRLLHRLKERREHSLRRVTSKVSAGAPSVETVLEHADRVASFDIAIREAKEALQKRTEELQEITATAAKFAKAHAKDLELVEVPASS